LGPHFSTSNFLRILRSKIDYAIGLAILDPIATYARLT
jgi:hypothetical protein